MDAVVDLAVLRAATLNSPVEPQAASANGWVCPQCRVTHSPNVLHCFCQKTALVPPRVRLNLKNAIAVGEKGFDYRDSTTFFIKLGLADARDLLEAVTPHP